MKRYWRKLAVGAGAALTAIGVILGIQFYGTAPDVYDVLPPLAEGVTYDGPECTKVQNPDGTITATIQAGQNYLAEYQTETGAVQRWEPIDARIVAGEGGWDYGVQKNRWKFAAKKDGTVGFQNRGSKYVFRAVRTGYFTPGVADYNNLAAAAAVDPIVENNAIVWADYFPGVDQIGLLTPESYKESFLIKAPARTYLKNNPPALPGDYFAFVFEADWSAIDRDAILADGTTVQYQNAEGDNIGFSKASVVYEEFPPGRAFVSADGPSVQVKHKLVRKGLKNYLLVGAKYSDLMALPAGNIILDPTMTFQQGVSPTASYSGCEDGHIKQIVPNTNYGTATTLTVGDLDVDSTSRSLILFNHGYLTNVDITSAVMSLYCSAESGADDDTVNVYKTLLDYRGASATWNVASTSISWNTAGCKATSDTTGQDSTADHRTTATATTEVTGISAWYSWDVTSDYTGFISGGLDENNYGWIIINVDGEVGASHFKTFSSANNATAANRPKLSVTYTLKGLKKTNKMEFLDAGNEYLIVPNRSKTYANGETKDRALTYYEGGTGQITESTSEFAVDQSAGNYAFFRTTSTLVYSNPWKITATVKDIANTASASSLMVVWRTTWGKTVESFDGGANKLALLVFSTNKITMFYVDASSVYHYWDGSAWGDTSKRIPGKWAASTTYETSIENDGTNYIISIKDSTGNHLSGSPATIDVASVRYGTATDYVALGNSYLSMQSDCNITEIRLSKQYRDASVDTWMTVDLGNNGTVTRRNAELYLKSPAGTDTTVLSTPQMAVNRNFYTEYDFTVSTNDARTGLLVVSSDWDGVPDTGADDWDTKIGISFGRNAGDIYLHYRDGAHDDDYWDGSAWQEAATQWAPFTAGTEYTVWVRYIGKRFVYGVRNTATGVQLDTPAEVREVDCYDTGKANILYLGSVDSDAGTCCKIVDDWEVWYSGSGGIGAFLKDGRIW